MTRTSNRSGIVPNWLSSAINIGLIGGLVAVITGLEGMVVAFNARFIVGGVVTMGQMLIIIAMFVASFFAIQRSHSTQPLQLLATAAIAGFVTSALLVVLLLLGNVVNLGAVFINAVPDLYALLTFQKDLATGSVLLLSLGVVVGLFSAALHFIPSQIRRLILFPLVWVVVLGLFQDLIVTTLSNFDILTPILKFLYASNGLSVPGAITAFIVVLILYFASPFLRTRLQGNMDAMSVRQRRIARPVPYLVVILIVLILPSLAGIYLSQVLDDVGLYVLLGLGLNIVVGLAGLLDLGYVAFYAIGAYTVGVLTTTNFGHPSYLPSWWLAVPFAIGGALLAGVLLGIPVLKVRGDYLAIVTLGFGEIIRLLVQSDFLKPFLGGAQGVLEIAKPVIPWVTSTSPFSLDLVRLVHPEQFFYIIVAGCVLVAFVSTRLKNSRLGRAWMAMREDEDVAEAMGIDLVATKLLAFGMGASFGGLSGGIFASQLGSIFPPSFNFLISVNILSLIIIGGMGSIPGVIVGALALVGMPELLREFSDYRFLFYGVALVLMMLLRPEGLWPEQTRLRELHEVQKEAESEVPNAAVPEAAPEV